MGWEGEFGSIEPGKTANLLLTQENPLRDLSALKNPKTVFINGIQLDGKTLGLLEDRARNRNNLLASILRYAENLLKEK